MTPTTHERLERGIHRWDLVAFLVNMTIGAGIFGLPSRVYALAGTYSTIAFLVCALLISLVILCFAEVGSRFEQTGGPYLYAREAFGPSFAFQVGWLMWLQRVMAFAAVSNLFASYLGFLWPPAASGNGRAAVLTAVVASMTWVIVRGVRGSAIFGNLFTVGKLVPLAILIAVGIFFIDPRRVALAAPPSLSGLSSAVLLLVFAFSGFDAVVVTAGEMHEPRRNLPFAMFAAIGVVALIYTLIQLVCIGTLPGLAGSERPLADAGSRFLGPAGGSVIAIGALISTTGTLLAILLAAPRILFALAEHGQLPRAIAATHARTHTPHVAIVLTSAVMLVVTLAGSFLYTLTVNVLIRLIVYCVTCGALIALRRRKQAPPAMFRVPAGLAVAIVTLAACLGLVARSTAREARDLAIAVAIGVAIFLAYRWKRGAEADQATGGTP